MIKGKVGTIGRFKPLHKGAQLMLETLCSEADEVIIGIGSSNKYDVRNPFTAEETEEMINSSLSGYDNYSIVHVPDFAHLGPKYQNGQAWRENVLNEFGNLDYFVAENGYVKKLLSEDYEIVNPVTLIAKENQIKISGTMVRIEMAKNGDWQSLVSETVAQYLTKPTGNPEYNNLVERFRNEFGLETLSSMVTDEIYARDAEIEYRRTLM